MRNGFCNHPQYRCLAGCTLAAGLGDTGVLFSDDLNVCAPLRTEVLQETDQSWAWRSILDLKTGRALISLDRGCSKCSDDSCQRWCSCVFLLAPKTIVSGGIPGACKCFAKSSADGVVYFAVCAARQMATQQDYRFLAGCALAAGSSDTGVFSDDTHLCAPIQTGMPARDRQDVNLDVSPEN